MVKNGKNQVSAESEMRGQAATLKELIIDAFDPR